MSKPVAIITGASRGIGRGIATELAKSHSLVATYRGRLDAAESLRAETGAEIIQCDIGNGEDRARLLAFTREKFGRLDLLVNNAGMAPRVRADMLAATEESFDELINTNLKGPHFLTQAAANWMAEQGETSDIAKAVRGIADGLLDYSTGQVLNVDGGFHLRSL